MKTYEESERASHSDTEITLGMRSILGIFFALALICGVFFGFGYSLGRGNAAKASLAAQTAAQTIAQNPPDAVPPVTTVVEQSSAAVSAAKPSAGAPLATPSLAASDNIVPAATAPPSAPQATKASYGAPAAPNAVPATYPAQPAALSSQAAPPQAIMVQIAAVSRREDADALVSALNKLGYGASVHTNPPDSLLHVQIGPFATRDAAKTMRAKLLNDGYNAILK